MLVRVGLSAAVAAAVLGGGVASASPPDFTPGAPGAGDPFFPLEGNGGYDVGHYKLRLDYDPVSRHLDASATITAQATQDLSRFDLDLRGFDVSRVVVNGRDATVTRDGQELQITPARGV